MSLAIPDINNGHTDKISEQLVETVLETCADNCERYATRSSDEWVKMVLRTPGERNALISCRELSQLMAAFND
ncbi:hypothetical protein EVAR_55168_1 [Eumeta japonica]|uniref:Uncharacterized protein n=1 Tax=Eumeta variegata TaxID=151549 RepID=A0A4C1Y6Q7_EUMVA|nr:hypothetical protein EVAR_55168_1 [Eumeta japonica]